MSQAKEYCLQINATINIFCLEMIILDIVSICIHGSVTYVYTWLGPGPI